MRSGPVSDAGHVLLPLQSPAASMAIVSPRGDEGWTKNDGLVSEREICRKPFELPTSLPHDIYIYTYMY